MASLTVTSLTPNSSTPVSVGFAASSSNGDSFLNTGREVVLFQNSSSQGGASVTVTVAAQQPDNYGGAASTHNITAAIASSSMGVSSMGPFRPSQFNDVNGLVQLTYSVAGIWVKVVSVAPQS